MGKGHEIVAAIAETHLTDTARQRIKELLPQGTALADASTPPDKDGRKIPTMEPYHSGNTLNIGQRNPYLLSTSERELELHLAAEYVARKMLIADGSRLPHRFRPAQI